MCEHVAVVAANLLVLLGDRTRDGSVTAACRVVCIVELSHGTVTVP